MSKEGSVAPKERINMVFKPATGDAKAEVELPLKLLMVGDFTGEQDDRPVEDRKPISIDKSNFDDVLRNQNVSVSFNVENKLSGQRGDELPVNIGFGSMRDFSPEEIAKQVPEMNQLLELREALTAMKGPLGNVPAFRKKLQAIIQDDDQRRKLMGEMGINEADEK